MKIVVQVQMGANNEVDCCFLSFDEAGKEFLKSRLEQPHVRKQGDHIHLLSDEWGTGELSSKPYFEGCPVVHHLELFYLGTDEGTK